MIAVLILSLTLVLDLNLKTIIEYIVTYKITMMNSFFLTYSDQSFVLIVGLVYAMHNHKRVDCGEIMREQSSEINFLFVIMDKQITIY